MSKTGGFPLPEGFCIGCGSCAFARPDLVSMVLQPDGHWTAAARDPLETNDRDALLRVCPMSGMGADEDAIAADLFPDLPVHAQIGRHARNLVGHVAEDGFRDGGSSGGMITWMLAELLQRGEVDAVLHVKSADADDPDGLLFRYGVSDTVDGLRAGAKSRYYPVEMSHVLTLLAKDTRRFAVVGLPCFIKAVRQLERENRIPPGRVQFSIGLVCGHLKSRHFASYLAWQKDIAPDLLTGFDFRRKLPDRPASSYGFAAIWRDPAAAAPAEAVHPMADVQGRDWGEGILKNPACEFCDDVMAECADIVMGDAWLPDHVADWRGTNVVTVRDARLDRILSEAGNRLAMEPLSADLVAQSQSSGLRHRREGLAHRLARRKAQGLWSPRKRVAPALAPQHGRRAVYDVRLEIARQSAPAFARALDSGQLAAFERDMAPLRHSYRKAMAHRPLIRRVLGKLRRMSRQVWNRVTRTA